MKVVNQDGRFQFIKNQIVKIDSKLPKYQKLKLQRAVEAEEYRRLHGEQTNVPVRSENGESIHNSDNLYVAATGSPISTKKDTDLELRRLIIKMKEENTIRAFLNSPDAQKFNSAFINILIGENDSNHYDLQIPQHRWVYENPHPITESDDWTREPRVIVSNNVIYDAVEEDGSAYSKSATSRDRSLVSRITSFFKTKTKNAKDAAKDKIKSINGLSVLDLFDILHVKKGQEADLLKRLEGFYTMLDDAETNGQTALFDELAQKIFINVYESVLAVHGYNKYIHFGELEELQKKCVRVLDIDYISDFGRIIPADVSKKKKDCDNLCVFDNYCVLYYDPDKKMPATKKEAKAKRDPILFGLINHSDKLYYIDSWTDELCDLTIETVADKLGKNAVKEIK